LRTVDRGAGYADCPSPLVKDVEDVRLAEIDLDRPSAGASPVVPLEAAVDAGERHLERQAAGGPFRDEFERRPDHPDQVPVVLSTEVGLDFPAVVGY
jgi:hypothetical protein